MKSGLKTLIFYVVFIVAVFGLAIYLMGSKPENVPVYSDIIEHFQKGEVAEFEIDPTNKLTMKLKDEKVVEFQLRSVEFFMEQIKDNLEGVKYNLPVKETIPWWVSFLPYVIVIFILVGAWIFFINRVSKTSSDAFRKNATTVAGKIYGPDDCILYAGVAQW